MIRCVVFDFDGTLVDSNEIKRRAFFDVLSPFDPGGRAVSAVLDAPDAGDRHSVMRAVAARLAALGKLPSQPPPEEFAKGWVRAYSEVCARQVSAADEIPGASAMLGWLRAHHKRAFLSSATPEDALREVVALRGMTSHFDGIHGRPASKPEHLARIGRHAGVGPRELVMVGDGEDDRAAAAGFGCPFIGVERGGPPRFLEPPERRIADMTELPPLLEELDEKDDGPPRRD